MKKIMVTVAAVAIAFVISGCSSISAGIITDKTFREAWVQQIWQCQAWRTTSNGGMTCMFYGYTNYYHDDRWTFDLQEGDQTGWVNVTETAYNSYEIGDYFSG